MTLDDGPARDPDSHPNESPAHRVDLPRFFIARYPVTVAQWRVFYEDADVDTKDSLGPWSVKGLRNHPVVNVSWFDALAYCRWLTMKLRDPRTPVPEALATLLRNGDGTDGRRWVVTLPSEAEWEKAARGTDGRRYPWGDAWDGNRANYGDAGIKGGSAVGTFSGGSSPYGIEEQSGNVWEWTRSQWRDGPYEPGPAHEDLAADDERVVRGGAFNLPSRNVRAAFRNWSDPDDRYRDVGFRVVVSPFLDPLVL